MEGDVMLTLTNSIPFRALLSPLMATQCWQTVVTIVSNASNIYPDDINKINIHNTHILVEWYKFIAFGIFKQNEKKAYCMSHVYYGTDNEWLCYFAIQRRREHLVFLITSIIITHHRHHKGDICLYSPVTFASSSNPVPHEKQPLLTKQFSSVQF